MAFPNIFTKEVSDGIIDRLNKLTPESERHWGKMDVSKMLAHCMNCLFILVEFFLQVFTDNLIV